ncbi:MAG: Gfo/Idh/MocA family oxidoreductase [Acidobacteriaceae bacterium]|nr:Gfo/Idh/MocA family oxidoreductase [Acidobacteriaceae bacterium]
MFRTKIIQLVILSSLCFRLAAREQGKYTIAVIGLVHAHVWGHLKTMVDGKTATLVGVSESNPELVSEAKKAGVPDNLFFGDYKEMLDKVKPDIVWAFVENNRHLEIAKQCAPRHINLIFEKPTASTYAEAKQIEALAQKYDVRVMTNYQMAWWPSNYAARSAVEHGDIGTVYRLHGVVGHGGPGSEGARNKFFFDWLTDPVKNGAGALMDFGCYNALWSVWYLGMPQTVYATALHLRAERFPKVEDAATLVLTYPNAVGIFEGSWDLPHSFQDLEVFGRPDGSGPPGSLYMTHSGVQMQVGHEKKELTIDPLPPDESEPVAYMVSRIQGGKPIEGLTAMDINVKVIRIIDLAKESIKTGRQVSLSDEPNSRP